jgi:hypothetical protein
MDPRVKEKLDGLFAPGGVLNLEDNLYAMLNTDFQQLRLPREDYDPMYDPLISAALDIYTLDED